MDSGSDGDEQSAKLIPLAEARNARLNIPVTFNRQELDQILRVYSRMVAANEWRDYAIDHLKDQAVFSIFRRASEMPLFRVVKTPALARKQGAYSVVAAGGLVMKRGHELATTLKAFDRTLKLAKA